MSDGDFSTTRISTPSVQVVIESLIEYAQRDYESKRIGWASYAAYTTDLFSALCGSDDALGQSTEDVTP